MDEFTCTRCGGSFPVGEQTVMGSDLICECCTDEHTRTCQCCGERIWEEDVEGDEDVCLCRRCFESNYSSCDDCGRLITNNNTYESEGDDSVYCYRCYERHNHNSPIHAYNYKPNPVFYGHGSRYFGVELEIDDGGKDKSNALALQMVANAGDIERVYIKSDGSLDDGLEIVTHPMTLGYHESEMPWKRLVLKALALGYYSHKAETCGLHVHVNRDSFGDTREVQEDCISRVLFVVERFWSELLKFSRRTPSQLERWAARYGYKQRPKEILDHAKSCGAGRYTCVNITNYHTIEFRIFRGTLRHSTILATIQMVDEICSLAMEFDAYLLENLSWPGFVERISKEQKPELVQYLKERRLYLNEPTECIEED